MVGADFPRGKFARFFKYYLSYCDQKAFFGVWIFVEGTEAPIFSWTLWAKLVFKRLGFLKP